MCPNRYVFLLFFLFLCCDDCFWLAGLQKQINQTEVKITKNENTKDDVDGHVTENVREEADHVIGADHAIDHEVDHVIDEAVARHVSAVGHVNEVGHVIDTGGEAGVEAEAEAEVEVVVEAIVKNVMDVTGNVKSIVIKAVKTGNQREQKTLPRHLLS